MAFLESISSLHKSYYKVGSRDENANEGDVKNLFLPQYQEPPRRQTVFLSIAPWAVALLFALLYASTFFPTSGSRFGSYENGFSTEFGMLLERPPKTPNF